MLQEASLWTMRVQKSFRIDGGGEERRGLGADRWGDGGGSMPLCAREQVGRLNFDNVSAVLEFVLRVFLFFASRDQKPTISKGRDMEGRSFGCTMSKWLVPTSWSRQARQFKS